MDFSRIAPVYRWIEYFTFGNALQKRRCAFLREVGCSERVLLLGDGDGRFAAAYFERQRTLSNRSIHVDFLDGSAGMVQLAKRRIAAVGFQPGTVRFRLQDARTALLCSPYDLVVSHFFLDCFSSDELRRMIPRIAAAMPPGAKWLISEFAIPPKGLCKIAGRLLIRFLYLFFRLTTGIDQTQLPDYTGVMAGSGFRLIKHESAIKGLLVSQLWSKLSDGQRLPCDLQDACTDPGAH